MYTTEYNCMLTLQWAHYTDAQLFPYVTHVTHNWHCLMLCQRNFCILTSIFLHCFLFVQNS